MWGHFVGLLEGWNNFSYESSTQRAGALMYAEGPEGMHVVQCFQYELFILHCTKVFRFLYLIECKNIYIYMCIYTYIEIYIYISYRI